MATAARTTQRRRRPPREARPPRSVPGTEQPNEKPTAKSEKGRLGRMMDWAFSPSQSLADRRDKALEKTTKEAITPEQRLKFEAIDQRANVAKNVARKTMDAIVKQEKRFTVTSGSVIEAAVRHPSSCEDKLVVNDKMELYAVIDGMSSPSGNEAAAKDIAEMIERKWRAVDTSDPNYIASEQDMREIMNQVNQEINDLYNSTARTEADRRGAVGTVVKLVKDPSDKRRAIVGHVGDTRLYVRKADGRLEQKTKDHGRVAFFLDQMAPAEAEVLRSKFANVTDLSTLDNTTPLKKADGNQVIDEEGNPSKIITESWLYDQGYYVSQHIGGLQLEPQIFTVFLAEGDQLLLSSDGIHDLVPDANIGQRLSEPGSPEQRAQNLLSDSKAALRKGPGDKDDDDRTAIVVDIGIDPLSGEVAYAKDEYRKWAIKTPDAPIPVPVTPAQQEGIRRLLEKEPVLQETFQEGAKKRYEELQARGIDSEDYWKKAGIDISQILNDTKMQQNLARLSLDVVDRRAIYAAKVEAMIERDYKSSVRTLPAPADVMRESIKYTKTSEIAKDNDVLYAVMDILEQVALRSSDTQIEVSTLVSNSGVVAMAAKLGFKQEAVAELLINQVRAISEAARQQEKAQHGWPLNLLKAAAYAGTGLALTVGMAATPLVALAGVGAVRVLDAFVTTRVHEKNRKKIEEQMRQGLKAGVRAFKEKAAAERTNEKVPQELRGFVDGFVAMLALAKRDQIMGVRADFESNQGKIDLLAKAVAAGDPKARQEYDKKVADQATIFEKNRKAELKTTFSTFSAAEQIARDEAFEQWQNYDNDDWRNANGVSYDSDEFKRLGWQYSDARVALENKQAEFESSYFRVARAEAALYRMDQASSLIVRQARLSAASRKSFWDRNPSLRAIVGGGETTQEKVTSIGVFMGAGFIARQSTWARVLLSGYAVARTGEALARVGIGVGQAVEAKRQQLSEADITAIDITKDTVFDQLHSLTPRVAAARQRLLEGDLRATKPAEHARLLQLVERFDEVRVTAEANRALARISAHTDEVFAAHDKNISEQKQRRRVVIGAAALGAVAGGFLGYELVEWAAQHAEARATATDVSGPTTIEATAVRPIATLGIAATNGPEAVAGNVAGAEPVLAEPAGNVTWHEATVHGGAKGEGVWHALDGQTSKTNILTLLKETKVKMGGEAKVKMDGREVAIFDPEHGTQLGVKTGDTLTVIVDKDASGQETLRFLDAKTQAEIPPAELHKYFYKMGIHGEVVADASSSGAAARSAEAPATGGAESTGESHVSGFAKSLWSEGMSRAEFMDAYVQAYQVTHDVDLASAVGQKGLKYNQNYLQLMDTASRAYDKLASSSDTTGGDDYQQTVQGATTITRSKAGSTGGGGITHAEPKVPTPRAPGPSLVSPDGDRVLSSGELAAVDFSRRNYDADDHATFVANADRLLVENGNKKFITPNNLEFSKKGPGIYVDVPKTGRQPQLLTEQLYQAIQERYQDVKKRTEHEFLKSDWAAIIQKYKEKQRSGENS